MKKILKTIFIIMGWTIGFPCTFFMGLGYWMEGKGGISLWKAIKKCNE